MFWPSCGLAKGRFLSTPSARRATRFSRQAVMFGSNFYPRPPRGGRLPCIETLLCVASISIHALREEGDSNVLLVLDARFWISIHALREEGDSTSVGCVTFWFLFLSTPSARRATNVLLVLDARFWISIHALREEGDFGRGRGKQSMADFYPRPPRGGRPTRVGCVTFWFLFLSTPSARRATGRRQQPRRRRRFLSTPSARRATAKTETKSLFSNKLYNILHEFRRALIYNGSKNYPNHAK